jgi:hypothetical protein
MNDSSKVDVAEDSIDAREAGYAGTAERASKDIMPGAGVDVSTDGSKPLIVGQMKEEGSNDISRADVAHLVPLSWTKARATLAEVLEKYMKRPLPVVKSTGSEQKASPWQCCSRWGADFYAGALPMSAALLALSITSLEARKRGDADSGLNASAALSVYRTQVAGATLLLAGTLISIFLVKRREHIFARDSDVAKRTTISRFLQATEEQGGSSIEIISGGSARSRAESEIVVDQQLHHSGTSRTDIYPAYRRSDAVNQQGAFWHRVPTLLLVKGDFIALQVGDVAPTRCKLLDTTGMMKSLCVVEGGERITIASFGDSQPAPTSKFLRGKSVVPPQSRQLLELCNHLSVFVVEETPLESFLNLPHGKSCFVNRPHFPPSRLCFYMLFVTHACVSIFSSKPEATPNPSTTKSNSEHNVLVRNCHFRHHFCRHLCSPWSFLERPVDCHSCPILGGARRVTRHNTGMPFLSGSDRHGSNPYEGPSAR